MSNAITSQVMHPTYSHGLYIFVTAPASMIIQGSTNARNAYAMVFTFIEGV